MIKLGKKVQVDVREIWKNEAFDFTPWLADNLKYLNDILGLDLELEEREASVGKFSADLVAVDQNVGTIVIENQFGTTDHDHFGKLWTYAAGVDASVVIWIAEIVRDEHKQALEWINQRTDTNTQFFALELEVYKIDDSQPTVDFTPVVKPNQWTKSVRSKTSGSLTPYREAATKFHEKLRDLSLDLGFNSRKIGSGWCSFPTGLSGVYLESIIRKNNVQFQIVFNSKNVDLNKTRFDFLFEEKEQIEKEVGSSLEWKRNEDIQHSRIVRKREGSIEDPDQFDELLQFQFNQLKRFRDTFSKYIVRLRKIK